jgi:hypothetical protein
MSVICGKQRGPEGRTAKWRIKDFLAGGVLAFGLLRLRPAGPTVLLFLF